MTNKLFVHARTEIKILTFFVYFTFSIFVYSFIYLSIYCSVICLIFGWIYCFFLCWIIFLHFNFPFQQTIYAKEAQFLFFLISSSFQQFFFSPPILYPVFLLQFNFFHFFCSVHSSIHSTTRKGRTNMKQQREVIRQEIC